MSAIDEIFSVFSNLKLKTKGLIKRKLVRSKNLEQVQSETLDDNSPEFSWWAPRNWSAFFKTLVLTLIILSISLIFIRVKDLGYDDPFEFEQVYYLNNSITISKKSVTINCNLFGSVTKSGSQVKAEIVHIKNKNIQTSINDLTENFFSISTLTLKPGKTEVTLKALPQYANLSEAFAAMAQQERIKLIPSTGWRGAIFSFELIMHVKRDDKRIRTVSEVFHFREDAWSERLFVIGVLLAIFVSILFIIEFRKMVNRSRKKKRNIPLIQYLRTILKMIRQVLLCIDFPNGEWKFFIPFVKLAFDSIISSLDRALEKLEHKLEREEKPVHLRIIENFNDIKNSIDHEYIFENKKQLAEIVIRQCQEIETFIKKLTWREIKALPPGVLKDEILNLNQEMKNVYNQLKVSVNLYNRQREERKIQHENLKIQAKQNIVKGIKKFLERSDSKEDINQLARTFPVTPNINPKQIFKIEDAYSKGEFELIEGELKLFFPFLSFPVPTAECGTQQPIFLEISRINEEYSLFNPTHYKLHKKSGTVMVKATLEKEVNIQYDIKFTDEISFRQNEEIKISMTQIELINPHPDPEEWFKLFELSQSPKLLKI